MTRRRDRPGLLAWYPPAWRERYGEEMLALIDDSLEGRHPPLALRASLVASGLRQRARDAGLTGTRASVSQRRRAGSLLVLVAWSAFVLAGAGFAKVTEHFSGSLAPAQRSLPQGAYDAVVAAGALGTALVVLGALIATPAFVRHLRRGGAVKLWPHLRAALVLVLVALAGAVAIALWAHHLTSAQRNGADAVYGAAVVAWAVLVAAALARVTSCAVVAVRAMEIPRRVLGVEVVLALGLTGAMSVVTAGALTWWISMSTRAPWYLVGAPAGSHRAGVPLNLVGVVAMMVVALAAAGLGVGRVVRRAPAA